MCVFQEALPGESRDLCGNLAVKNAFCSGGSPAWWPKTCFLDAARDHSPGKVLGGRDQSAAQDDSSQNGCRNLTGFPIFSGTLGRYGTSYIKGESTHI